MNARRVPTGPLVSVLAAAFWLFLAWRTPTSTHHFAPLVVAGAWGSLSRMDSVSGRLDRAGTVGSFGGGLTLAFGVVVLLAAVDKLQGPGLYGSVPVVPELVLHGVVGAVIGARPWTLLSAAGDEATPDQPDRSTTAR